MLSIGEFSQAARLTVKTLRYYHELGILMPVEIDSITGYRFYNFDSLQRAASISLLKEMGFSLKEIRNILDECSTDDDVRIFIKRKLDEIKKRKMELEMLEERLESFDKHSSEISANTYSDDIQEIDFEIPLYVSRKVTGKYSDIGQGFKYLFKHFSRYIDGKPYGFVYDLEYRENDATMEAVVPVNGKIVNQKNCKTFSLANKAVKCVHKGPYGTQGESYARLFEYCRNSGYEVKAPIVEHYIKGPGMIFRGNPDNYVTECFLLIK